MKRLIVFSSAEKPHTQRRVREQKPAKVHIERLDADSNAVKVVVRRYIADMVIKKRGLQSGMPVVPGVLFAGYLRYIDPTSFTILESVFILSIIIIGGTGNTVGALVVVYSGERKHPSFPVYHGAVFVP